MNGNQPSLLPGNYEYYDLQIAGHQRIKGTNLRLSVLEDKANGQILKPLQDKGRGEREKGFYQYVNNRIPTDPLLAFIPQFFGTTWVNMHGKDREFLILENLTAGFVQPCVLDVKIGGQTWEPSETDAKKSRELEKYPWGLEIGFRLLGMKVFDQSTQQYISMNKTEGRQISPNKVLSVIDKFLSGRSDGDGKSKLIRALILRLDEILQWFESQSQYHFYSSSLLVIYEGSSSSEMAVTIRMIDFTHVLYHGKRTIPSSNPSSSSSSSSLSNPPGESITKKSIGVVVGSANSCCLPSSYQQHDTNYIGGLKSFIDHITQLPAAPQHRPLSSGS